MRRYRPKAEHERHFGSPLPSLLPRQFQKPRDVVHRLLAAAGAEVDAFGEARWAEADGAEGEVGAVFADQPVGQDGDSAAGGDEVEHQVGCLGRAVAARASVGGDEEAGVEVQALQADRDGD